MPPLESEASFSAPAERQPAASCGPRATKRPRQQTRRSASSRTSGEANPGRRLATVAVPRSAAALNHARSQGIPCACRNQAHSAPKTPAPAAKTVRWLGRIKARAAKATTSRPAHPGSGGCRPIHIGVAPNPSAMATKSARRCEAPEAKTTHARPQRMPRACRTIVMSRSENAETREVLPHRQRGWSHHRSPRSRSGGLARASQATVQLDELNPDPPALPAVPVPPGPHRRGASALRGVGRVSASRPDSPRRPLRPPRCSPAGLAPC